MEHPGSQAATEPKESPVSPRKAGKPTDAATLARPAGHGTARPTPGADNAPVQDGGISERAPATSPHRPRPASPPRVGRSPRTDPPPTHDPRPPLRYGRWPPHN